MSSKYNKIRISGSTSGREEELRFAVKMKSVFTDIFKGEDAITEFLESTLDLPKDEYEGIVVSTSNIAPEYRGIPGAWDIKILTKSKAVVYVEALHTRISTFENYVKSFLAAIATDIDASGGYGARRVIGIVVSQYPLVAGDGGNKNTFLLRSNHPCIDIVEFHTIEMHKSLDQLSRLTQRP